MGALKRWLWFLTPIGLARHVSAVDSKMQRMEARTQASLAQLQTEREQVELLKSQLETQAIRWATTLKQAESDLAASSETNQALREELRTCKEITIPGLVAANQVFVERWSAEAAVHAANAVFAKPSKDD